MSGDLACTYAALILHDDGQEVDAEKMATIIKAAGVTVEPYWPMLFGKLLATKSIGDMITNVGAGGTLQSSRVSVPPNVLTCARCHHT